MRLAKHLDCYHPGREHVRSDSAMAKTSDGLGGQVLSDITITFLIIAVVVVLFVWNKLPVAVVAMLTPLALFFTGVLDYRSVLLGFGDPVVIFVASLLVLGVGLDMAGVTTWAGQQLAHRAGASPTRLIVLLMLVAAVLSSALGFMGTAAALLPVAVASAARAGVATSRVLMPMAFASSAGGLLTLTASPVNMIVTSAAENAGFDGFAFLEFALAGAPLVAGAVLLMAWLGPRVLPERNGASLPTDMSRHGNVLVEHYGLQQELQALRVNKGSALDGAPRSSLDLAAYPGLSLVTVRHAGSNQPVSRATLAEGDVLLMLGDASMAERLSQDLQLSRCDESGVDAAALLVDRDTGLAELVIPARSPLVGRDVFPGMATSSGNLMVLGVQRGGIDLPSGPAPVQAGDHLLLKGSWQAFQDELSSAQVMMVDAPDAVRRHAVALGSSAPQAIAVVGLLVLMLASGWVPPAIAGVSCAILMVVLGVLTVPQAYRGMDWNTVVLLAGMIPLSTAITKTGAAELLAHQLLLLVGDAGPVALLAGLFMLTVVLGQLISNTATALIIAPIAISAALEMGMSPRPVLMSMAVAAGASFLTPIATPPNLLVMGPGGYRFGDYWKLGLPLTLWFFVVAVYWVPVVWPLARP
jgi:di/tricarboxylate transporter